MLHTRYETTHSEHQTYTSHKHENVGAGGWHAVLCCAALRCAAMHQCCSYVAVLRMWRCAVCVLCDVVSRTGRPLILPRNKNGPENTHTETRHETRDSTTNTQRQTTTKHTTDTKHTHTHKARQHMRQCANTRRNIMPCYMYDSSGHMHSPIFYVISLLGMYWMWL